MPYCADCGEEVESGHMFCPNCGHDLSHDASEDSGGIEQETWGTTNTEIGGSTDEWTETGTETRQEDITGTETGSVQSTDEDASSSSEGGTDEAENEPTTNVDGESPFTDGPVSFAASYSVSDDWDPVLIGAVIEFGGMIIPFVSLLVRGYGFRLATAAARGQTERPTFDEYGEMFIDGFRVAAVVLVYVFALLFGGGITAIAAAAVDSSLGLLVIGLWGLAMAYAMPASLTAYAAHESIKAAFSPTYAGAFALTGTYVKAYVVYVVVSIVVTIVALVSLFTIVGFFVVVPWSMYLYSAFWGYYYREAVEKGEVPPAPAEAV